MRWREEAKKDEDLLRNGGPFEDQYGAKPVKKKVATDRKPAASKKETGAF